jgi:hypothetical protein
MTENLNWESLREATGRILRSRIAPMLAASRYRDVRHWPRVVAVFTPGRAEIVPRLSLAIEFQGADLPAAAHEVMARRVGPGEVLAYGVVDEGALSGVAFLVVPITAAAIRKAAERRRERITSRP